LSEAKRMPEAAKEEHEQDGDSVLSRWHGSLSWNGSSARNPHGRLSVKPT
jgi:hypothetical protein